MAGPTVPPKLNPAQDATGTNNSTAIFDQIATRIIKQQEAIIGPVAIEQAKKVQGINVDWVQHEVDIKGNPQSAIDGLVKQYKELFGQIAVETCKQAAAGMLAKLGQDQVPASLK